MSHNQDNGPETASTLAMQYRACGEHPRHRVADWQYAVANGNTRRSYWDWVAACIAQDSDSASAPGDVDADRVASVVRVALDAFWLEVAAVYPEVKTGDLAPDVVRRLDETAEFAVKSWLAANSP